MRQILKLIGKRLHLIVVLCLATSVLLTAAVSADPDWSWTATTTTDAPSVRTKHVAVWTGSEMIVWGGGYGPGYPNDGSRYNLDSDTWTALPTSGLSGREWHTAVWTGTEMIVWGGRSGSTYFQDGARYNPTANSWTSVSTIDAPAGRYGHTAVWTGSEMIIWGGYAEVDDGSGHTESVTYNDGACYNPSTDTWAPVTTTNAPSARSQHTAVWTGSEMIVWGGSGGGVTGGRYDPISDSWTETNTTGAPSQRWRHTAVWTGSEMIVWGGLYATSTLSDGARYNPTTDSWAMVSTTDDPSARLNHSAIWTGSEMIIWGGLTGPWASSVSLNTGGHYDPATNSWTETSMTSAPDPRDRHTVVWTGSEMIVWGGMWQKNDGKWDSLNTGGSYASDMALDTEGPVTSGVVANPSVVSVGASVTVTAIVDDSTTGGSNVASAEYSLDGSTWEAMDAVNSPFDNVSEDVTATFDAPTTTGVYNLCVRGKDASSNTGPQECVMLVAYDPSAGFVTGGGWIDSPPKAYTADLTLTGKATFGFVSKYKKEATAPTGQTEFQFKAGDLNFHSSSYDWLVVTGSDYAKFKGSGTINGTGDYKFKLWAGDDEPDTFRIKIWLEDEETGEETVVYDNGSDQAIGGGQIVVHK